MNGKFYESYKEYVASCQERKLILFGAGKGAKEIIFHYYPNDEIAFICDNDKEKEGKKILGISVYLPEKLYESPDEYVVLITVKDNFAIKSILQQLKAMNVTHCYPAAILQFANMVTRYIDLGSLNKYVSVGEMQYHELNTYKVVQDNMKKILTVREMLSDEKSKKLFDNYIEKVQYNVNSYDDISDDVYEHYFTDGIFKYSDEEILVDGGAFDGADTIRFAELLKQEGKRLKKSYCFEPDCENFRRTCNNLRNYYSSDINYDFGKQIAENDNFMVYQAGLYDRNAGVGFRTCGSQISRLTEQVESAGSVSTACLDDILSNEKVSFIKFDLEGADIPAILGAEKTIKKNKPKLALSIYHNIEDLWEIALMIKSFVPEYKLFVRHHSAYFWDKILYAALECDLR